MRFDPPLVPAVLLRRYKRFLADVRLDDGRELTAHTPNTGSMAGCSTPGSRVWLSVSSNPSRKFSHTLELVAGGDDLVGVNTHLANRLAEEAIRQAVIPALSGYLVLRREVAMDGHARLDLRLEAPGRPLCWVEVKNVTLAQGQTALFPDAPTERGRKHLERLAQAAQRGERAVMLYLVQRNRPTSFAVASSVDPLYAKAFLSAEAAGVEMMAWGAKMTPEGIAVERALMRG